ncbi:MAG: M28 family peptidase [bacterium]|nr:M28 family peptidase [bacterium]
MDTKSLYLKCRSYLEKLCVEIPERCVGSEGNTAATRFFEEKISSWGWDTTSPEFDVIDWEESGALLRSGDSGFNVFVSPYSLGCLVEAPLVVVSTVKELEEKGITGKVVLLSGVIAKEQIMPKNFVFYNPEEHRHIVSLLESKQPAAIITATGRNAALAGGVYPFPMFEDGDFDIPSVYMTEDEGKRLAGFESKPVFLKSVSKRIPSKACNVIAGKGKKSADRIVLTAHIDAKKGSPGAIDNATGVVVLLLLAELLKDYEGEPFIEIVPFNGEDYYAVSGQMHYIAQNNGRFDNILLNINLDGAGYKEGKSAFSFFGLPGDMEKRAREVLAKFDGIIEGQQWQQGDHSIFIQYGRPALAVSSKWFLDNIASQDITHTPKDNIDIVDCNKLVEIAEALKCLLVP